MTIDTPHRLILASDVRAPRATGLVSLATPPARACRKADTCGHKLSHVSFADLFARAAAVRPAVDVEAIRQALADERATRSQSAETDSAAATQYDQFEGEPSPARVVADADVLAADLFVDGHARAALDLLRAHSWTTLVASDTLLDDLEAVVASLADPALGRDWRAQIATWRTPVSHPAGDHPALSSAYRGGAMQVIALDARLTGPRAAAGLRDRLPVSVREPRAFEAVFSPARLYPEVADSSYPGPDRDARSW